MGHRISVAFKNMADPGWLAGGQYLYNLLYAVKASHLELETVLRVVPNTPPESYALLDGLIDRVIEFPPPMPKFVKQLPGLARNRITPILINEDAFLRKHQIDAQFMLVNPGNAQHVPSATWIPDFQHLYFPELFTRQDLEHRANAYPSGARKTRLVVVSSACALKDLQRIAPDTVEKTRVLSFTAQIDPSIYERDPAHALSHFHLPEKFFFLPNQFWQHKNHHTVIQALAEASETNSQITVVCSGSTYDHRDPAYFDTILSDIATRGLQGNMRILGRISREYFYMLMRQSLAVLQPSLFEGWSTTVEEAKSLGKRVIASDIPVHREQNPPSALYFKPRNAHELAQHLIEVHNSKLPGPDPDLEQQARTELPARTRAFAETFYKIITEMVPV